MKLLKIKILLHCWLRRVHLIHINYSTLSKNFDMSREDAFKVLVNNLNEDDIVV